MAERDHLIIHRDALDIQLLAECAEAAQLQVFGDLLTILVAFNIQNHRKIN